MSTLYVIATPIGNLEDVTLRALRVLGEIDVLACEDTRRTRTLLEHHEVPRPQTILSYHEHNEERAGERILALLDEGRTIGLCSDAGVPGISDPGYRIVSAALDAGHDVDVLPGAGAVEAVLLASGLPTSTYTFKGFPPKKPGRRQNFIAAEAELPHTLVFFESPHRVGKLLADALAVLGDRRAAVCVELTKKFERSHRGYLTDLAAAFDGANVKGEVAVVIAGNNPKFARSRSNEDEEDVQAG
jgi:16S rRNA (cytidine1402-2'-O)-methyltransferase